MAKAVPNDEPASHLVPNMVNRAMTVVRGHITDRYIVTGRWGLWKGAKEKPPAILRDAAGEPLTPVPPRFLFELILRERCGPTCGFFDKEVNDCPAEHAIVFGVVKPTANSTMALFRKTFEALVNKAAGK